MTEDPIARMKQDFIADASDTVEKVSHSLSALDPEDSPTKAQVDWLFRTVHSLKGTSGMFELHDVSTLAGAVEDLLEVARSGRGEVGHGVQEILTEAFDELAILLQRGRGIEVESSWERVKADIDRMTKELSGPAPAAEDGKDDRWLSGLPAELKMVLSSEERSAVVKCVEKDRCILRIAFDFGADASPDHDEVVLRRLQQTGDIITILPPGSAGTDDGKRVLSLVYSPDRGDAGTNHAFRDTVAAYGAAVTDITPKKQGGTRHEPGAPRGLPEGKDSSCGASGMGTPLAVKVDIGVLDSMLNTVSELYSVRLGLLGVAKKLPHTDATRRLRDDLLKLGLLLNNRVGALEEAIAEVRLVPVSILFERYRGEVRRLARSSGKKVDLAFEGEATRIDRAMLDNLHDPLLHIIRNAVDHGVETPEERRAQGKPDKGRIVLRAGQEASHIRIEVEDDGRGVDEARVRQKAVEQGIPQAAVAPPLSLIFEPGMSTSGMVTEVSGRGVGLDAAKSKIEAMKGMVTAGSVPGHGTRFSVYVPLTLAISRGVLVEESGLPAVVPLRSVVEVLALRPEQLKEMQEQGTIGYRGSRVKAIALCNLLKVCRHGEARSAVVLGVGEKRRILVAQRVTGEADIVSRPLPEAMVAPSFIAGGAELHDGRPAIIIQPEDLLRGQPNEDAGPAQVQSGMEDPSPEQVWQGRKAVRLLIFESGDAAYALSLDLLSEVITLRSMTPLPVLGETWEGVFFHRGMCHGLLSLCRHGSPQSGTSNAAILGRPERCGVGMHHIYGYFTVPVPEIAPVPEAGGPGLLRPCGMLRWQNREVTILAVGRRAVEGQHRLLDTSVRKR
jgi:two-component system chemotaxis sensor kinase CheA